MAKVIASHNGLKATERAYDLLLQGAPVVDAVVEGVTLVEDDPDDHTVGYGGLPNEAGVVELDAAVMDGATHRGGAVAALEGIRHAARVAKLVMQQTKRVMLAGEGARRFALANGFHEENLLTESARKQWLDWLRKRSDRDDWLPPDEQRERETRDFERPTGTVHVSAIDDAGNLACATSTSGHAFKMPGRVGDSPILGSGLYVDNEVATCGAVGWGEGTMQDCASAAVIELIRGGATPEDAAVELLERMARHAQPWQRKSDGRPGFNIRLFVLAKNGAHSGASLWGPAQMAVCDENGNRLEAIRGQSQRSE